MSDALIVRDGYPAGVPCWVDTNQPDAQVAAAFYSGLFGWELEDRMPPDAPGRYLVARLHGHDVAAIGSQPGDESQPAMWNTYIGVDDAEVAARKVREAGGGVLAEPFDVATAGRMAVCADPAGAVFCLWQAGENRGAALVNYPNTWNWSDLSTPDVEGAKAFYGAVFGWEARTLQAGETMSFTMWCLPGYAEHLAQLDPDIRKRQADEGAPEGFADAIAGLNEDAVARWSVTFTVDDTDAAAARAVELGGQLVMEPFDAGPTRIAAVADPAGATFSVLRFDPS